MHRLFAYGSNTLESQMAKRTENSNLECVFAVARDQKLVFNKARKFGTAAANIEPCVGESVQGLVYDLTEFEISKVDEDEKGYDRRVLFVECDGKDFEVEVYVAQPEKVVAGLKVADEYRARIVDGLEQRVLEGYPFTQEYVTSVKNIIDSQNRDCAARE